MQPYGRYKHILACVLLATVPAGNAARAEILPWLAGKLSDPFAAASKATGLTGAHLKPAVCPGQPDLKDKLRLKEVVIAAVCNNPDARSAYFNLLGQADSYASNYSGYLPTITASVDRSHIGTFHTGSNSAVTSKNYGVSAGLTLYDFGQREFKLESAEDALVAARYSYDSTLQGMITSALSGYYQLLTSQNGVEVARESERYARESYDAATMRYTVGQAPLADQLQSKSAWSQAILARQQAGNQLLQNRAALALLMGLPADAAITVGEVDNASLAKDPFGSKVQELMVEAKRKRADLQAARAQVEGSKASLKALERSDLATISATVNVGLDNDSNLSFAGRNVTRTQAIGVNVSIPLFTGFSQTYNERAAKEQLKVQEEGLVRTELGIEQDVWNAWNNYETAKQVWETSQDLIASATQAKNVALGRYREGLGTILDVLNAQAQYNSALQSQLQSRYNLLISRVNLVRALGVIDLDNMHPGGDQ